MSNTRLTRAEAKARTRVDLLRAASQVFARRGYAAATVQEIAEEAERTTGALYAHFESKEDLFLALLEQRDATRQRDFEALHANPGHDIIDRFGEWFGTRTEDELSLLAIEFWLYAARKSQARTKQRRRQRRVRDGLASILTALFEESSAMPPRPVEELATLCLALGDGLGMTRIIDPNAVTGDMFAYALRRLTFPNRQP